MRKIHRKAYPVFKVLLESTSDSTWSIDTDYQITYANKVFKNEYLAAYNILITPGINILNGLPDVLANTWKARYDQVFENESIQVVDQIDLPCGSSYFLITLHPIIEDTTVVGAAVYSRDITNQKHTEIELKKTKETLEQAGEMAQVGAFEINPETSEVKWSSITRQIHEVPDDYIISISEGIRFYKDVDQPQIESAIVEAIEKGIHYDGEHQLITYTGKRKWVRVILKSEFKDGICMRLYGTFQDITDRKLSFELQQQFIEEAPSAIAMFDRQMRYLACSKKWKEDHNLGQSELKGRCHYDVFPEIGEEWKHIHQVCLSGKSMEREEDLFLRKDGSVNWNRWKINPWYEPFGKIGGIIMLTEDITQRKLATYKAVQFGRIFEKSLNEIYILDAKTYHFKQVNAAALANLGYSMEELAEMRPTEIIPNLTLPTFEKILYPLRNGAKDKIILQKRHRRKDGTSYPVEMYLQFIVVEDDAYFVCFILDISEKTNYLQAIEEQNAILKEIAWVQSHVLRAPLSRMMMLLMLLENDDITYHPDDLLKSKQDVIQAILSSALELDTIISKIIAKTKELENRKLPLEPNAKDVLVDKNDSFEVLLVDADELSQLVNRYSIIQHGLHDKPKQFRDCRSVWDFLQEHDCEGKNILILFDVTLLESDAWQWLKSLQSAAWLGTISFAILSTDPLAKLDKIVKRCPLFLGAFQNPLKKQQIDQLRNLLYIRSQ